MQKSDAKKGMKVTFGRSGPRAAKAVGVIEKCNPARAKIRITEQFNSYSPGQVFNVAYELMKPLSENGEETKTETDSKQTKIEVGKTLFRSGFADGNPLWKVIRKEGRNYRCEVQNEKTEINGKWYDSDWVGTQKIFTPEEIRSTIGLSDLFKKLDKEHTSIYDNLIPGQIIHYNNGHGCWVRCETVVENGKNVLKPIALLGEWQSHELPSRRLDGSIYNSYYVNMILNGETFAPNASHLFEAKSEFESKYIDPSTLDPISLEVPEMEENESLKASLWKKINEIQTLCGDNQRDPQSIIDDIKSLIK